MRLETISNGGTDSASRSGVGDSHQSDHLPGAGRQDYL